MKVNTEVRECVGGYRIEFDGLASAPGYSVGFVAYQRDPHPIYGGGISQDQALMNARRMALAWNLFDGLPIELMQTMPGPVAELACLHADAADRVAALTMALVRLINCPALNLDDLEAEDRAALENAKGVLLRKGGAA